VVLHTLLFGKLYLDHGKLPEAKELLLKALEGAENNRTSHWIEMNAFAASCARFLADVYRAEGNTMEADHYVEVQRRHKQSPTSGEREIDEDVLDDIGQG
jgi:hypothetical protein